MLNTLTFSQKDQIISKSIELFTKGCAMFGLPACKAPEVRFDVRGTTRGYAGGSFDNYYLRYNPEAYSRFWDESFSENIPHEVAHLVVSRLKEYGRCFDKGSHGPTWKRVCLALGGNAKRCHELPLTKARNRTAMPRAYLYRTPSGREIKLTVIRHRRMQTGKYRGMRFKDTKETILPSHYVGVVY